MQSCLFSIYKGSINSFDLTNNTICADIFKGDLRCFGIISFLGFAPNTTIASIRQIRAVQVFFLYSTNPYLTLMRSSFSSIGSAANHRKIHVAAA